MSYPRLSYRYTPSVSRGSMGLLDLRHLSGVPCTARELTLLSLCDGTRSETQVEDELCACGLTGVDAHAALTDAMAKFSYALERPDAPGDPAPQIAAFKRTLTAQQKPWPFFAQRESAPTNMEFTLTRLCNHRCTYCFQGIEHAYDDRMPTEVWMDVMEQCRDMGVTHLELSGGEPALHPAFWPILEYAQKAGMYTQILTNGTLFDAEKVKRLSGLGVDFVYFSLPSVIEARYDAVSRSTGDLPKAIAALRAFKRAGMFLRVKMVLTPENATAEDVRATCDFCYQEGVDQVHLAPFILTRHGDEQCLPSWKKLDDLIPLADALRDSYHDEMMVAYPDHSVYEWRGPKAFVRCGGVKDQLKILPNGDITFCEQLALKGKFIFGNVKTDRLEELWWSDKVDEPNYPRDVKEPCASCKQLKSCQTGCLLYSWLDSGELWGMDPCCYKSKSSLFGRIST